MDAPTTPGKITYSVVADPNNAVEETDEGNNTSDTIATYIGDPPPTDLAVTQTDDPDPAELYERAYVRYNVKVVNNGPETAFNVLVYNVLSNNVTFDSGYGSGGNGECNFVASYNTAVCPMGNIPSGKSSEARIYVETKEIGTISNTATVYSDNGDTNSANDSSKEDTAVISSTSADPPPSVHPPGKKKHKKHRHKGGKHKKKAR